jgi:alpha-galactosidase
MARPGRDVERDVGRAAQRFLTAQALIVGVAALVVLAGCTRGQPTNQHDDRPTTLGTTSATTPGATQPTPLISNGLAKTPVMGFNDWNAFGCDVSATLIEQTADAMLASGMLAAGYTYVDIDDCWMSKKRSPSGHLVADPHKFADGIRSVADYVHARGFKLGIYESAGHETCAHFPGSLGHEKTDAADFAAWGVDLLKYDNCGTTPATESTQAQYVARYAAMATALADTGRPIVYSICEWGRKNVQEWAPSFANMWRTTTDIHDSYSSMLRIVTINAAAASAARPGGWNDPDMLEIGNGGMSAVEQRSEFSLWAIMAAPLIAGTDLRGASAETMAIYLNHDVIAVDQDALGRQGVLVSSHRGLDVFVKQLSGGDVAVALFNEGAHAATISATINPGGAPFSGSATATDLWSKRSFTIVGGRISAEVPPHATEIYRVHAEG